MGDVAISLCYRLNDFRTDNPDVGRITQMQPFTDIELRAIVLIAAMGIDRFIGEPTILWRRLPHPVAIFGRSIGFLEQHLNKPRDGKNHHWCGRKRRFHGILAIAILVIIAGVAGYMASKGGFIANLVIVTILLAGKSLHEHLEAVAQALHHDIVCARKAVSMIIGRRTDKLDKRAIARAAIETGAENLSDGVFAPALWYLAFGLPGILIYKMVNTADSMTGYKNARYFAYGYGAAKLDDLLNYIPARITALLIGLDGVIRGKMQLPLSREIARDARTHSSPNAGWPEATMAHALGIWLAGPRMYGNRQIDAPRMNDSGYMVKTEDINRSLTILSMAQILFVVVLTLTLAWHYAPIVADLQF